MPVAGATEKWAGQFFDNGGAVINATHPDYGASPGATASANVSAIATALAAASAAGGGTVLVSAPGTYDVNTDLSIPNKVSFVLAPGVTLRAVSGGTFTRAMVICGAFVANGGTFSNGGAGNRYGFMQGGFLDGNDVAPIGLYVGESVERGFYDINIRHCTAQGLVVDGGQNNTFVNVNPQVNGTTGGTPGDFDCNLMLDRGAGNNVFVSCKLTADVSGDRGKYNIIFRQSGTSPTAGFAVPTGNSFWGGPIERATTAYVGCIYHRAGKENAFNRLDFQTTGTRSLVIATDEDGVSQFLTFSHCKGQGTIAQSVGFTLTNVFKLYLDNCRFENFATLVTGNSGSQVYITGDLNLGSVTTRFASDVLVWWNTYGRPGVSLNRGDAAVTLRVGNDEQIQRFQTTLTADRAVTLSTTGPINGAKFRIVRSAGGAFNLNVGSGPLKAMPASSWADFEWQGGAWMLTAYGSL